MNPLDVVLALDCRIILFVDVELAESLFNVIEPLYPTMYKILPFSFAANPVNVAPEIASSQLASPTS